MKQNTKYIFLTFIALSVSFLSIGCAGFSKKSSNPKEDRLALVDLKIKKLEQSLSNLDASTKSLVRFIEELSDKTSAMEKNYSKFHTKLYELSSKMETKDSSLESALSDTQKTIEELEKKLNETEEAKTDLQNQISELQAQRHNVTSPNVERPTEAVKEEGVKADVSSVNQKKEALQKLLDEAQELYRSENYKEAIGKWQEALNIDPESLEAKLNMEIAKEKIQTLPEKEK